MKRLGFLGALLGVAGVVALGGSAAAAPQMTMSPGSSEIINIEAGMTQTGSFKIYNTGDVILDIKVAPSELCVNDRYQYTFEGCSVASGTTMKNWIVATAEKAVLNPGDETQINYTINVPPTGLPGGSQHAGITVTFSDGGQGLGTNHTLGYRLSAFNPVGATTNATLLSAKVDRLQFKRPISARATAKNDGNSDFFIRGTMRVSTLGGREVHKEERSHVVMPGTTREATLGWEGSPHLGIFKVKYDVVLESIDGKLLETKTIERVVMIMPLFMFVVIMVVIAALLVFLVMRIKKNAELKNARRY
ncbi:hypothetical protein FWG86_00190 [Candidatus Saccharibacteria bacterium]|nr:hypothetical protein [Candidatus Saccharibacteria bacterium]